MIKANNVILIVIDNLRRDGLSFYNKSENAFSKEISRKSLIFENCISSSNNSVPSISSIFTGVYPYKHGCRQNGVKLEKKNNINTLSEILQKNGIKTYGIIGTSAISGELDFNRGFKKFIDVNKITKFYKWGSKKYNVGKILRFILRRFNKYKEFRNDEDNIEQIKKLLGKKDNDGYFLFAHLSDLHEKDFKEKPHGIKTSVKNRKKHDIERWKKREEKSEKSLEKIFSFLENNHLLDDTLVVVTSDHGESLYEHIIEDYPRGNSDFSEDGSYKGHGYSLYNEEVMVPLIFYHSEFTNKRYDRLVRTIDITPTILTFLGIDIPENMDGQSLFGNGNDTKNLSGYSELPPLYGNVKCLRDNKWKYIWNANGYSKLFDMVADPNEKINIIKAQQAIEEKMENKLQSMLKAYGGLETKEVSIEDHIKEELIKLGYYKE